MLRKLSLVITGALLVSGAVAAAQASFPFPMSVNETGPNYPIIAVERALGPIDATASSEVRSGSWEVRTPISVNETGPNYPTLAAERASAPIGATASGEVRGEVRSGSWEVQTPSSVNETGPNYPATGR